MDFVETLSFNIVHYLNSGNISEYFGGFQQSPEMIKDKKNPATKFIP